MIRLFCAHCQEDVLRTYTAKHKGRDVQLCVPCHRHLKENGVLPPVIEEDLRSRAAPRTRRGPVTF